MGWNDLMAGAAATVSATFGQLATTDDHRVLRVILDVISQTSGTVFEPIIENHPVIILLRSEVPEDGLDAGTQMILESGESYEVEGIAQERTNRYHIAYWVKRIED